MCDTGIYAIIIIRYHMLHFWFSVTELEHFYFVAGITYAADVLSYIVLIHLLWPSRSVLYLIKGDTPLPQYDLEAAGKYYCTMLQV